jgi:hypothetical protein
MVEERRTGNIEREEWRGEKGEERNERCEWRGGKGEGRRERG